MNCKYQESLVVKYCSSNFFYPQFILTFQQKLVDGFMQNRMNDILVKFHLRVPVQNAGRRFADGEYSILVLPEPAAL